MSAAPVPAAGAGAGEVGFLASPPPLLSRWLKVLALLGLLLAVLSFGRVAVQEMGPRGDVPLAHDELYFMACAARGLAVGEVPVAGCHDTKAPLIFLLHQLVQALQGGAGAYDFIALKVAAYAVVAGLLAIATYTAYRLGGRWAAIGTAALTLQVFAMDTRLAGLKTELIGSVFMLAGMACLLRWMRLPRLPHAALAGLLFGLALASKQTFVFALPGPLLALGWLVWRRHLPLRKVFAHVVCFVVALFSPLLLFLLAFWWQGRLPEFLGALLLYPVAYAPSESASAWPLLVAKGRGLVSFLIELPHLLLLLAVAVWQVVRAGRLRAPAAGMHGPTGGTRPQHLRPEVFVLLASTLGMLLLLLVAPVQFYYHLLPAWPLLAVLGGWVLANTLSQANAWQSVLVLLLLALGSGMQTHHVWTDEAVRDPRRWNMPLVPRLPHLAGQYAYVLGVWPTFYVVNGLVPASNVMYPNALPGAPASWNYVPPRPDSRIGRQMLALQHNNAQQLLADFNRTPPRVIMVVDADARSQGARHSTDIAVLARYIASHCQFDRQVPGTDRERGTLYGCR